MPSRSLATIHDRIFYALYCRCKYVYSDFERFLVDVEPRSMIYQLLSGRASEVKAYATFPIEKSPDELVDAAEWLAEKGFEAMKIGAGFGVAEDRERITTVMENIPTDFGLAIDTNTSYTYDEALTVAKTASQLELEWFE